MDLNNADVALAEMCGTWEDLSILRNNDYLKEKMSTIQNPTIRYVFLFLGNSIFARQKLGVMAHHNMASLQAG